MKKFLASLIKRVTSLKFLLTLSTALVLVANQQWNELVVLILGYIGVEGAGDVVSRYGDTKVARDKELWQLENLEADDPVDKTTTTPGVG